MDHISSRILRVQKYESQFEAYTLFGICWKQSSELLQMVDPSVPGPGCLVAFLAEALPEQVWCQIGAALWQAFQREERNACPSHRWFLKHLKPLQIWPLMIYGQKLTWQLWPTTFMVAFTWKSQVNFCLWYLVDSKGNHDTFANILFLDGPERNKLPSRWFLRCFCRNLQRFSRFLPIIRRNP